jgi:hypothetical protein
MDAPAVPHILQPILHSQPPNTPLVIKKSSLKANGQQQRRWWGASWRCSLCHGLLDVLDAPV